jgi:hypothetical protein
MRVLLGGEVKYRIAEILIKIAAKLLGQMVHYEIIEGGKMKVTQEEYSKKMDEILAKHDNVGDALAELIEESGKMDVFPKSTKNSTLKKRSKKKSYLEEK